jgi:two-component system OmpR family sensor kinase
MSIFKKITFLFIASFILMSIIGLWIDNINTKRIDDLIKQKYLDIANEILLNIENQSKVKELFEKYKLEPLDTVAQKSETLYKKDYTFGYISINKELLGDEFILQISYLDEMLILKTPDEQNINDKLQLNILIFLDIFILLLIFLYILKLLHPLKQITKEIENFSDGNLNSRSKINTNNEIGALARTFNTMADSIENLVITREELLRDIGHELKTPITKGRFAVEKVDNPSQRDMLKKIFIDLENLTNELIELEKLNSSKLEINVFNAETLLIEAFNKLYIADESKIILNLENDFQITGNLQYLCTAMKNLIENALKYASKFPISIHIFENKICISNYGKPLSKPLEYYLKPFTQEISHRDGFGLGLSIVKKVLDKHGFHINYEYKNGLNHFCVVFI